MEEKKTQQVKVDDVDPLRLELETLLVAVVCRKQQMRAQLEALDRDDSVPIPKLEKGSSPECSPLMIAAAGKGLICGSKLAAAAASVSAAASAAVMAVDEVKIETPSPSIKTAKKAAKGKCKRANSDGEEGEASKQHVVQNGQKSGRYPISLASAIPNDSNHRFWTHLDEFCCPPSEGSMQVMETIIEQQETLKNSEFVKVPTLGQHYTVKWAKDDLLEEQLEAAPEIPSAELKEDMERILRQSAKESLHDERCGSLAQRLMTCLIDQSTISPTVRPRISSNLRLPTDVAAIEERIRKELEDLGVMQALADQVAERDDEIFLELRKCQSQLLSIARQNVTMTKLAIRSAAQRMAEANQGSLQRAVDGDILDHFKKRKTMSQKKNTVPILAPPTKKEKEQLHTLLEKRRIVIARIERLPFEFLNHMSPNSSPLSPTSSGSSESSVAPSPSSSCSPATASP